MAIIANWKITSQDKNGNPVTFSKGDQVTGVGAAEEARLVKLGAAQKVPKVQATEKDGE